jgi:hypothetical protein
VVASETTAGKNHCASTKKDADRCSRWGSLALARTSSCVTGRLGRRMGCESNQGNWDTVVGGGRALT